MIHLRLPWKTVLVVVILLTVATGAGSADRTARVVFLSATAFRPAFVKEFEEALQEAGWVSGHNIVIEYRSAEGQYDRLPALVEEVLRLKPQVILASQTPATQAIRKVTDRIPIVMVGHGDPVRYGLVRSLARPEGNITGTAFLVNEVGVKVLEILKEAVPTTVRVGVFVNPDNPGAAPFLEAAHAAAPRLGLTIRPVQVATSADLSRELEALTRERVDAIWLAPEAFILTNRQRILEFALARRLPAVGPSPIFANSGALLSYSPHASELLKTSVRYVDKLLRGAKPQDLPIEQPSRFELVVNARTAKALGLALPPAVLLRVDRVIN